MKKNKEKLLETKVLFNKGSNGKNSYHVCEQISIQEESSENKSPLNTESHTPQIHQETQTKSTRCSDYVRNDIFDAFNEDYIDYKCYMKGIITTLGPSKDL